MPSLPDLVPPPFDDATAAALAAHLRAAARHCDQASAALRRERAAVAASWRGPAGDEALDRSGRAVAELERVAAACDVRAKWIEAVRAHAASARPTTAQGLHLPDGFRLGPPFATSAREAPGR